MSPRFIIALLATLAVACSSPRADRAKRGEGEGSMDADGNAEGGGGAGSVNVSSRPKLNQFDTTTIIRGPKGEGYVHFNGRTWYRVVGPGKSATPVILIHDGPGGSSFALKTLEALSTERPVVRYDQLGGGKSEITFDHIFTIQRYVAELDSVRVKAGYGRVHLIGHSFGALIALEYYKAHPSAVASLTLESPEIDFPALAASINAKVKALPDSERTALGIPIKLGTRQREDYQRALMMFIDRHVCCRQYVAADMDSMAQSQNDTAYALLRGPNEVVISGLLANYSATPILGTVNVPVLFTVGENDVADVATVQKFASMTRNGRAVVLKGVRHFPTWEAPEENLRVIREFLRDADARR